LNGAAGVGHYIHFSKIVQRRGVSFLVERKVRVHRAKERILRLTGRENWG